MKFTQYVFLIFAFSSILACGENKPKSIKKAPTEKEMPRPESKKKTSTTTKEAEATSSTQTNPTPPEHLEKAAAIIASVDMNEIATIDGKKLYKRFCAACHGFKGDMGINGAKDLTKSKVSLQESVAQVYFGKGLMNAHKGLMDDEEIVAVAKYIETLRKY